MEKDTKFNVKNRSAGMVVYRLPEYNIRREFAPGETKVITYDELEKLSFQQGGRDMMANYLQIQSAEATKDLNISTEPEYNMSEEDVVKLLLEGSLDSFLDALDFAPTGVIDLIKQLSVSLPLNDIQKRRALKEKTGFDVNAALTHVEEELEDQIVSNNEQPTRRVKVEEEQKEEGRRTTLPEYKVTQTKSVATEQ
jgi:hypothetical protein